MSTAVKIESRDARSIPYQEASLDIWDKKYRLTAKDGTPIDRTMDDTYKRVARALADVEKEEVREHWYEQFLWALRRGAIPAGRITSNAGAQEHKPATSTINCTVSGTVRDSMDDILRKVHEAASRSRPVAASATSSRRCGRAARTCPAPAPIPPARCRSWISTTKCASPSLPPAAGAARKWRLSTSAIPMSSNLSAPNAKTDACASSTCRC